MEFCGNVRFKESQESDSIIFHAVTFCGQSVIELSLETEDTWAKWSWSLGSNYNGRPGGEMKLRVLNFLLKYDVKSMRTICCFISTSVNLSCIFSNILCRKTVYEYCPYVLLYGTFRDFSRTPDAK